MQGLRKRSHLRDKLFVEIARVQELEAKVTLAPVLIVVVQDEYAVEYKPFLEWLSRQQSVSDVMVLGKLLNKLARAVRATNLSVRPRLE
jgi:hypothetical protein